MAATTNVSQPHSWGFGRNRSGSPMNGAPASLVGRPDTRAVNAGPNKPSVAITFRIASQTEFQIGPIS